MTALYIYNARILTQNDRHPLAEALWVRDGRIVALGSVKEVADRVEPGAERLDAAGAVMTPGFIDSHVHMAISGMGRLAVDLSGLAAVETVLRALRDSAAQRPADGLVIGLNFQPELNPENRWPTPRELDEACGSRAVYVMDRSGHQSFVNQAALDDLALPPATPGVKRAPDGSFLGMLSDEANTHAFTRFWARFGAEVGLEAAFQAAAADAVRGGITSLHVLEDLEVVEKLLTFRDRLPVRVTPYTQTRDVAAVLRLGLRQIGGCGLVMVDGDFTPHTAALLEPYADQPETNGKLYYTQAELDEYVWQAHAAGLQVGLHCVGSGAIEQLLNAYEKALARLPRSDHRHRIEHFELPAPGQAERARRLGLSLAMQPSFNHYWPHHGEYPGVVGAERAGQVDPLASLMRAGLPIGLGSDSPVTPLRAMLWLHSAVNHSNLQERISPAAALTLATRGSAALAFEEHEKGSLEPGKLADFVLLESDPGAVAPEEIGDIAVLKTFVGGRCVYDAVVEGK